MFRNIHNKRPCQKSHKYRRCQRGRDLALTPAQVPNSFRGAPPDQAAPPKAPAPRERVSSPLEGTKDSDKDFEMVLPCLARSTLPRAGSGSEAGTFFLGDRWAELGGRDSLQFCAHLHIPSVHCQETASFPDPAGSAPPGR